MANCKYCIHVKCCERDAELNGAVLDHSHAEKCDTFRRAYGAPLTRVEEMRDMTDQELAEFLCDLFSANMDCDDSACPGVDLCKAHDGRANGLLKWLRQTVEEDEDG